MLLCDFHIMSARPPAREIRCINKEIENEHHKNDLANLPISLSHRNQLYFPLTL